MNWMKCSGQTLTNTSHNALFSLLGTRYGGTTTTFKIPNLTSRHPNANTSYYICISGLYPSTSGAGPDCMLGSINLVPYNFIPGGTVSCSGQSMNTMQNQALSSLLQGKFGSTSTTFNLPNLTGLAPSSKMTYVMPTTGVYPMFQ